MLIARTKRRFESFNLDDKDGAKEYEALIADPGVIIVDKRFATLAETTYEGESSVSISRLWVYVEYEECSL